MPIEYSYEIIPPKGSQENDSTTDDMSISKHLFLLKRPVWFALFYLLFGILLVVSFALGSFLHPWPLLPLNQSHSSNSGGGSHLREYIPYFSTEITAFEFNHSFADDPGDSVTAAWVSIIPQGQGAIHVPIRNEFDNEVYNVAVYHAIHCLYTLRQSFFAFHQMATESVMRNASETHYMLQHGRHCIEYIRHSLMCAPDLTLEPVDMSVGTPKEWGIERQCIDFDELSDWARRERSSNEEGIV